MPILYLVQDNDWDISAKGKEVRSQNAFEYAQGFKGLEAISIDGANFIESFQAIRPSLEDVFIAMVKDAGFAGEDLSG